jgi:hypothetical protein
VSQAPAITAGVEAALVVNRRYRHAGCLPDSATCQYRLCCRQAGGLAARLANPGGGSRGDRGASRQKEESVMDEYGTFEPWHRQRGTYLEEAGCDDRREAE